MSAPGIFRPPPPFNEPVRGLRAGQPERESLQATPRGDAGASGSRSRCIIGGKEVRTGSLRQAVMPHREGARARRRPPGRRDRGRARDRRGCARPGRTGAGRPGRIASPIFLRAAELLAGPWRDTLDAATMLGQSKTAHQAEIDAACETIDFLRFNASYLARIYEEQPISSPGVWNRLEYRPLEGFVLAVSPFNFTAIGAQPDDVAGADGRHGRLEAGLDGDGLRVLDDEALEEAGLPPGVINLVYGSGAEIGDAGPRRAPTSPASTSPARRASSRASGRRSGGGIERYRNYPRIVGETGGKDFVARPSVGRRRRGRDRRSCAARSSTRGRSARRRRASTRRRTSGPRCASASRRRRRRSRSGDVADFSNFMGAVIDGSSLATQRRGDRGGARAPGDGGRSSAEASTTRAATSSSRRSSRPATRISGCSATSCSAPC